MSQESWGALESTGEGHNPKPRRMGPRGQAIRPKNLQLLRLLV